MRIPLFLLVAALLLGATWLAGVADAQPSPSREDPPSEPIAVHAVTVVDVEAGRLLPDRTVLVRGERIERIGPAGSVAVPEGARVIDGSGRYLLPGLIDAHVHFVHPPSFAPLLLAHGVTLVRDMGGDMQSTLGLRDELNSGERVGPEMLAVGPILDGEPPIWPFSEVCRDASEARRAVRKVVEAGVDQVKLYSNLSDEAFFAAVDEARSLAKVSVGHVPLGVDLMEAVEAGYGSIEHLDGFDELIARAAGEPVPETRSFRNLFARWDLLEKADPERLREAYAKIAERGTVMCPTIAVMQGIGSVGARPEDDPLVRFFPPFLVSMWSSERYARMAPGARRIVPRMQRTVAELHRAGVPLICGTDLGNPFVVPGLALHEEMRLFQDAGVPAADVVRSATVVPARFLGVSDRLGTVAEGKVASLLLVGADPLADVTNARRIEGVFLRGEYRDRAALDELIATAEQAPAEPAGPVAELSVPGEVVARGRYRVSFQGNDAGHEDFLLASDDEGWHLAARIEPKGGWESPSRGTFHFDRSGRYESGVWSTRSPVPLEVKFRVTEEEIVATAGAADEQALDLPDAWMFSGPFYSLQMAGLQSLDLDPGEEREMKSIGFGWGGWRMTITDLTVKRAADTELERSGVTIPVRRYEMTVATPMGPMRSELLVNEEGILLRATQKTGFGTVVTDLESTSVDSGDE